MFKRKNFLVDNNPDDSDSESSDDSESGDERAPRYDADGYRIMPSDDSDDDDDTDGSGGSAEEESEDEEAPVTRVRSKDSAAPAAEGKAKVVQPTKQKEKKNTVWAKLADEAIRGEFDASSSGGDDDSGDDDPRLPPVEELFVKGDKAEGEEQEVAEGDEGGLLKGRALRCMVCPEVLLLNEASLRNHVASKKHLKAIKRREPGWEDPILPAQDLEGSDSDSDDMDDDMMETHAERLARIRRMDAMREEGDGGDGTGKGTVKAATGTGGNYSEAIAMTRKERKKKLGRQRQRVRKLIKAGKLPPDTKPLKNRKERRQAAAAAQGEPGDVKRAQAEGPSKAVGKGKSERPTRKAARR